MMAAQSPYGKAVLLTGASSGIGLAVAEGLSKMGFHVYGGARRACPSIKEKEGGGYLVPIHLDVTSPDSIHLAVEQVLDCEGELDILINCAGVGLAASLEDALDSETRWIFEVNLFGIMNTCKAVIPTMRKQRRGLIVNTTSLAAFIAVPFQGQYSMTKAALDSYTLCLASELKPWNIHCCMIQPGDTCTGFTIARKYSSVYDHPGSPYEKQMRYAVGVMEENERNGDSVQLVAESYYQLVTCNDPPLRITPGGAETKAAVQRWKELPEKQFRQRIEEKYGCNSPNIGGCNHD